MTNGWWGRATARPVSYITDAGVYTSTPLGWVLHVVVGNGSPFWTFEGARSPLRRFSHIWVAKNGAAEQYAPITNKCWAQSAGNGMYLAAETEGFPNEPLTAAQIDTLAAWHNWTNTVDHVASSVGERGIGVHYMGGSSWGGHSCPDPDPGGQGPRSHQRAAIIDRAIQLRSPQPPPHPAPTPELRSEMAIVHLIGYKDQYLVTPKGLIHIRSHDELNQLTGMPTWTLTVEQAVYFFGALPNTPTAG